MTSIEHALHPGALRDARVKNVVSRLQRNRQRPNLRAMESAEAPSPADFVNVGFSIDPLQGDLIYLLCRSLKAHRVVDFATSVGMSTLYFAAAMRDNGGGLVIGSELVPEKAVIAKRNLADAGLDEFTDIRIGDARETLRDLG